MKIFEYNNKTFMVSDTVSWCAWDEDGTFHCYKVKPVRETHYFSEFLSYSTSEWCSHISAYEVNGGGEIIRRQSKYASPEHEIIESYDEYDIKYSDMYYDARICEFLYKDWDNNLIDVDAICILAEGLEDL